MSNIKSIKMYNFLYRTTRISDGKFYIGVHSTNDIFDGYLGTGKYIKRAIDKYVCDTGNHKSCGFKREILRFYDIITDVYEIERVIVNGDFIKRDDNFNLVIGGDGGWCHMIGRVVVKEHNSETFSVDKNDERYLNGELVHITTGKTTVRAVDGSVYSVSVDDERYLSGEFTPISYNLVTVKNGNGDTFKVDKHDPKYISGELLHNLKGYVTVKDEYGNTSSVSVDDERYLSGELVHMSTGKITVKDITGNIFQVDTTDQRYVSGELIHVGGENIRKTGTCPWCGEVNNIGIITRDHLDYCISNPNRKIRSKPKYNIITCPYCGNSGRDSNMKRYHFDKCKSKPI